MQPINLLKALDHPGTEEQHQTLLENRHVRLQRIISPAEFQSRSFLQSEDEWVLVLQGNGCLDIAGKQIALEAGDTLMIPANTPHQVLSTSTDPLCIWLTLHLEAGDTTEM